VLSVIASISRSSPLRLVLAPPTAETPASLCPMPLVLAGRAETSTRASARSGLDLAPLVGLSWKVSSCKGSHAFLPSERGLRRAGPSEL